MAPGQWDGLESAGDEAGWGWIWRARALLISCTVCRIWLQNCTADSGRCRMAVSESLQMHTHRAFVPS